MIARVFVIAAAALAAAAPARAAAPRFAATCHPAAAVLRELAAGRAEVTTLLPAGASPHTYEPQPSDIKNVAGAKALFYVSPLLDGWATRIGAAKTIDMIHLVPPALRLRNLEEEEGPGDDPHFWTDPLVVKATLGPLAEELARLDPPGAAAYRANAVRFAARLDALDREMAAILAPVRGRALLLFHPSLQHLAKRYGLPIAGVVEPSPGKEPTPRYLQKVLRIVKEKQVRAVFGEPQLPRRAVDVVAEAAGIKSGLVDPMGGVPGRTTYEELMRWNARALAEALR